MIALHYDIIEDSHKQEIVTNIEFDAIIPSTTNNFFHQSMVDFVNKLELSDQKYENNSNVGDEKHKGKLLFSMKEFLSFGKDHQSMYFMSTIYF